jgi:peptidoglycan/LPS O-acetylase OafA/YrhL
MEQQRLGHVDALRGFAALAVIYAHSSAALLRENAVQNPLEFSFLTALSEYTDIGKIAVTLFFAISGFVIPYSLFKPSDTPIQTFAITRFFRLYPIYWICILLNVPYLYLAFGITTSPQQFFVNLTMLQQFFGVKNIVELFWTLQIELIFYITCAALFARGWLKSCRQIALTSVFMLIGAIVMAAARFYFDKKLPVALPLALSVMFWGFLWRRASVEQLPEAKALIAKLTALIFVALVPICLLGYSRDHGLGETWYRYLSTYLIAMTIFMVFTTRFKIKSAFTIYLGQISYSIYLFGPWGQDLAVYLRGVFATGGLVHFTMIAAMLFTILIAAVMYRFIEKPAIAFGRSIIRRQKSAALGAQLHS